VTFIGGPQSGTAPRLPRQADHARPEAGRWAHSAVAAGPRALLRPHPSLRPDLALGRTDPGSSSVSTDGPASPVCVWR